MARRKKDKRGGARPGAGRKPILRDPVHVSLLLEADTVEALEELAQGKGMLFSGYVRTVLGKHVAATQRAPRRKNTPPGGDPTP